MNASAHTHVPMVQRRYPNRNSGPWEVKYGDTTVRICKESRHFERWSEKHRERVVAKATRKAIAKHDRGSIAAGSSLAAAQKANEVARKQPRPWVAERPW